MLDASVAPRCESRRCRRIAFVPRASFEKEYKEYRCYWGVKPSRIVVRAATEAGGHEALDLGAGEGRNTLYLARHGFSVAAVDLSGVGLEKLAQLAAREHLPVATVVADLRSYRIRDRYDLIVLTSVLHFLPRQDALDVIRRVKQATSRGGLNVIHVFTTNNPAKAFAHLYEPGELAGLYADWEILTYREFITRPERHGDGAPHRHGVAELLARKPLR